MSANEGQSIMKMTILTLEGMRSEECFLLFWEKTEKKRQELDKGKYQKDLRWGLQFLRQKNHWKTYTGRHTMRWLTLCCIPREIEEETGGTKLKILVRFSRTLNPVEHQFYDMVMKLMKIILIMPATNAISERTFSAFRHVKTWLRSTINQTRLNWCMILHIHNDDTD